MKKQTVLITGASSGIGLDTAILLQENGYQVYAAARRVDRMKHLEPKGIRILELDVTKDSSMVIAVDRIYHETGAIDVLINNAGYGSYGALEDVPMEEARYQTEVNLFGLARMCQLVIPAMREARHGAIVNVSSVGGRGGEQLGSWYHATKYAVEGLSDSLWLELKPFDIKVIVIEPGPIITEWGNIAVENLLKTSGHTAYATEAAKRAKLLRMINDPKFGSPAIVIAKTILKALHAKNPAIRYPAGNGAKLSMFLRKHLGDKTSYRLADLVMRRVIK
jgi:NAD(P)-dependent dehydrogenase (short-subunit alcohol dehydrogenase family)